MIDTVKTIFEKNGWGVTYNKLGNLLGIKDAMRMSCKNNKVTTWIENVSPIRTQVRLDFITEMSKVEILTIVSNISYDIPGWVHPYWGSWAEQNDYKYFERNQQWLEFRNGSVIMNYNQTKVIVNGHKVIQINGHIEDYHLDALYRICIQLVMESA